MALNTTLGTCTGNFLFRSVDGEDVYIATAGHCTSRVGENVSIDSNTVFGRVAYRGYQPEANHDFALVRVEQEFLDRVNPAVCYWGGPQGFAELPETQTLGNPSYPEGGPAKLFYYGHGGLNFASTRPREGRLVLMSGGGFLMTGPAQGGDSGTPVLDEYGNALGLINVATTPVVGVLVGAQVVEDRLWAAERVLGLDLELMTAPLEGRPSHEPSCGPSAWPLP